MGKSVMARVYFLQGRTLSLDFKTRVLYCVLCKSELGGVQGDAMSSAYLRPLLHLVETLED